MFSFWALYGPRQRSNFDVANSASPKSNVAGSASSLKSNVASSASPKSNLAGSVASSKLSSMAYLPHLQDQAQARCAPSPSSSSCAPSPSSSLVWSISKFKLDSHFKLMHPSSLGLVKKWGKVIKKLMIKQKRKITA